MRVVRVVPVYSGVPLDFVEVCWLEVSANEEKALKEWAIMMREQHQSWEKAATQSGERQQHRCTLQMLGSSQVCTSACPEDVTGIAV